MHTHIKELRGATLDGVDFRSVFSQGRYKHDNTCIMTYWNEDVVVRNQHNKRKTVGKKRLAFGIIQHLYYHNLWPDSAESQVIAVCDWYQYHGRNPRNTLMQIRRWPLWNQDCSAVFLAKCIPLSCVFYPSSPFAETAKEQTEYMDVLLHHEEYPKFDE